MKKLITQNPITSFVVVTFLYSWSLWLLMILSSKGMLPFTFPTNFVGSFGPAVGAIVVTLIISGKAGFKELMRKIFSFRAGFFYYIFALFFVVVVTAISVLLYSIFTEGKVEFHGIESWLEFILYFIVIFFVGGPLGEEIGWRGFLQPKLHKKFNPLISTLVIFIIWFAWHIPLFWLEGAAQEGDSLIYFAAYVLCMSFLFTWLYLKTNGSLMLALLFHTSINFITAYVNPIVMPFTESNEQHELISFLTLVGFTALIVLLSWKVFLKKVEI